MTDNDRTDPEPHWSTDGWQPRSAVPKLGMPMFDLAVLRAERDSAVRELATAKETLDRLVMAVNWLLLLKEGPRDQNYERVKRVAWAELRIAFERARASHIAAERL